MDRGSAFIVESNDTWVARLMPDGSPDSSFGSDGEVIMDLQAEPSTFLYGDMATAIAMDPAGGLIVASNTFGDQADHGLYRLVRLLPDGTRDMGYGTNGIAEVLSPAFDCEGSWLSVEGDGRALIASRQGLGVRLEKVLPGGMHDTEWGDAGISIIALPALSALTVSGIHPDGQGRPVIGGGVRLAPDEMFDLFAARIGNDAATGIIIPAAMPAMHSWPNPSSGPIWAQVPEGDVSIELFDGMGRRAHGVRVQQRPLNGMVLLDLPSTLAPGNYTLMLEHAGGRSCQQLVRY